MTRVRGFESNFKKANITSHWRSDLTFFTESLTTRCTGWAVTEKLHLEKRVFRSKPSILVVFEFLWYETHPKCAVTSRPCFMFKFYPQSSTELLVSSVTTGLWYIVRHSRVLSLWRYVYFRRMAKCNQNMTAIQCLQKKKHFCSMLSFPVW